MLEAGVDDVADKARQALQQLGRGLQHMPAQRCWPQYKVRHAGTVIADHRTVHFTHLIRRALRMPAELGTQQYRFQETALHERCGVWCTPIMQAHLVTLVDHNVDALLATLLAVEVLQPFHL